MNSIILVFIINNLFSQTPLINSINQIDEKVRNRLILSSSEYQTFKSSTTQKLNLLEERINNISTETFSNIFVKKSGDIVDGSLQVNGTFNVGSYGIWSAGDIYSLGKITLGNGIFDNNIIKFTINDKTSYLDYNKLYIKGDIDIEGNYLINGIPVNFSTSSINNYYTENETYYGLLSTKTFIIGNSTENIKLVILDNKTEVINDTINFNSNLYNIESSNVFLGTTTSNISVSTNNINLISTNIGLDADNIDIDANYLIGNINNLYLNTNQSQIFGNNVILGKGNSQYEFTLYVCMGGQYSGMIFTNTYNLCTQNNGTLYATGVKIK